MMRIAVTMSSLCWIWIYSFEHKVSRCYTEQCWRINLAYYHACVLFYLEKCAESTTIAKWTSFYINNVFHVLYELDEQIMLIVISLTVILTKCGEVSQKRRLWRKTLVSGARISNYIPQHFVGCNCLFRLQIPAAGTDVHRSHGPF